jgi:hypothetical protein
VSLTQITVTDGRMYTSVSEDLGTEADASMQFASSSNWMMPDLPAVCVFSTEVAEEPALASLA